MRFTDLMLDSHLISHGLEPIGIIGHQDLGSHTLGNRLDSLLQRLDIFGWECING